MHISNLTGFKSFENRTHKEHPWLRGRQRGVPAAARKLHRPAAPQGRRSGGCDSTQRENRRRRRPARSVPALTGSVEVLRQAGQVQGRQQGAARLSHQAVHGAGYNGQSPWAAAIFDPGRGGAALTPATGHGSS